MISVIIITYNEEGNIRDCLDSVSWADEVIVVDSGSTDRTLSIVSEFANARIINCRDLPYGIKRNLGIESAKGDWILWLDADERISDELRGEIIKVITSDDSAEAYRIKRKSFFINKFIKHCGWYPDYTLRLFSKVTGIRFSEHLVHELPVYRGHTGNLKGEIIHYTDKTFEHYTDKMNNYTTLSAEEFKLQGKKSGKTDIIFRPVFTFIKMYFLKLGFLDGYTGLILCILSSFHVMIKYLKLYYINQQ
ncbi:MAG: glycosyltransferase family 2 protein [Ignavibacteria bacterium]|nr:glycosyltransferase family 2 protein [Ignavibacteria bacterium]